MTGGIEAAGDAITGAILARTVERDGAVGADGHTHEAACLNCGAALTGPYCQACGQHSHIHRTLTALWHDLAHGVFHFEGKVWKTIPLLAWNPGALTRRYVHGERAKFVSPLALFLFSVFLMFAVLESVGPSLGGGTGQNAGTGIADAIKKNEAQIAQVEALRTRAVKEGRPTAPLDAQLKSLRDDLNGTRAAQQFVTGDGSGFDINGLGVHTGSPDRDAHVREALKNPKLLLYKLQNSAYKFAWALIPLSLPFMWLMFAWKRRFKLYDHAIFVTYSLSAVMLLLIVVALLGALGVSAEWALLLIPVHFFLQLKGAYSLGWFGALWRTLVLTIVSPIALSLFAVGLLLLGLLG